MTGGQVTATIQHSYVVFVFYCIALNNTLSCGTLPTARA